MTHPTRCYGSFPSWYLFQAWYSRISDKHMDEVIMDGLQKFRVDVDVPSKCDIGVHEWYDMIDHVEHSLSSILSCFNLAPVMIRYYSDSQTCSKRSSHIVVSNYMFQSSQECHSIALMLRSTMREEYSRFIDTSIYKTTQNFRIEGSSKPDEHRPKIRWHRSPCINGLLDGIITCSKDTVEVKHLSLLEAADESLDGSCSWFPEDF